MLDRLIGGFRGDPQKTGGGVEAKPGQKPPSRKSPQEPHGFTDIGLTGLPQGPAKGVVQPELPPQSDKASIRPDDPVPQASIEEDPIPSHLSAPTRALASLVVGEGREYDAWTNVPSYVKSIITTINTWDQREWGNRRFDEIQEEWRRVQEFLSQLHGDLSAGKDIAQIISSIYDNPDTKPFVVKLLGLYFMNIVVSNSLLVGHLQGGLYQHSTFNLEFFKTKHGQIYGTLRNMGAIFDNPLYSELKYTLKSLIALLPGGYTSLRPLLVDIGL